MKASAKGTLIFAVIVPKQETGEMTYSRAQEIQKMILEHLRARR